MHFVSHHINSYSNCIQKQKLFYAVHAKSSVMFQNAILFGTPYFTLCSAKCSLTSITFDFQTMLKWWQYSGQPVAKVSRLLARQGEGGLIMTWQACAENCDAALNIIT